MQVDALVCEMFPTNIRAFQPGGKLRGVLYLAALAIIRHNPMIEKVCGGSENKVSTYLRKACRKVKISDATVGLSPECVLDEWAKLIESDFSTRFLQEEARGQVGEKQLDALFKICVETSRCVSDIKHSQLELLLENTPLKVEKS